MDGWTCVWEQALAAITSLGAEWEYTRHAQERCPPLSLPQPVVSRLSQCFSPSGISAGVAGCSQLIPSSIPARPLHP